MKLALSLAAVLVSPWVGVAHAHDPFETATQVRVMPEQIEVEMIAAAETAAEIFGPLEVTRPGGVESAAQSSGLYELSSGGRTLKPLSTEVRVGTLGEEEGDFVYLLRFDQPTGTDLSIQARYFEKLSGGYTGAIHVGTTEPVQTLGIKVLHEGDSVLKVTLPPRDQGLRGPAAAPQVQSTVNLTFRNLFRVGAAHALLGYDHLLFLLGVLLSCGKARRVLLVLSTFTLAHSVTLSLAALHVVSLTSAVVEPLIALSIAVAAFLGRQMEDRRLLLPVTFSFGLVHGLGFASGLDSLGADQASQVVGLVAFNLGIELAQVGAVALVFPILVWCRRRTGSGVVFERVALLVGFVGSVLFVWRLMEVFAAS